MHYCYANSITEGVGVMTFNLHYRDNKKLIGSRGIRNTFFFTDFRSNYNVFSVFPTLKLHWYIFIFQTLSHLLNTCLNFTLSIYHLVVSRRVSLLYQIDPADEEMRWWQLYQQWISSVCWILLLLSWFVKIIVYPNILR